jgi:hypothetical protein
MGGREMQFDRFVKGEAKILDINQRLLGDKIEYLRLLGDLFLDPLEKTRTTENDEPWLFVSWWLAHITLNGMYNSFQSYLRLQNYLCLAAIRYGIDATLKAYVIINDHERVREFLTDSDYFKYIKRNVSSALRKGEINDQGIQFLALVHEECSRFGSHPDIDSLLHRRLKFGEETHDKLTYYNYFQMPENKAKFIENYFSYIIIYMRCLEVYKPFFLHTAFRLSEWDNKAAALTAGVNAEIAELKRENK